MTPREQVLANVRRSLGVTSEERPRRKIVEDRLASHPSGVIPARAASKPRNAQLKLFVEQAEMAAATVSVVRSAEEAPAAIADYLRGRNLGLQLRRGDDPRLSALPWGEASIDDSTGRSFGDDETGVSAAFGAVAETGTLALVSGPDNPTTLNFLPDNHIVLLDADDVSATYEDVWARVRGAYGAGVMPRTVNWITGPSRSADIEQILLMGAHGPRRLHIVLIDQDRRLEAAPEIDETVPAGSTPAAAEIRSTLGGGGGAERDKDAPSAPTPAEKKDQPSEDELDEELEESFPASDPPASTQP
ncbi:lactate utilization protein [Methylopila sp. M107]|uniref:LutC/YkgG family protein n=1 Tax=Methylopila sp. M107 TaxID=1101190 RepID=UPI00035E4DE4|nr:lactate utilization protein [Methylopila sp. M107]